MPRDRVTVTLPPELLRDVDRVERNRSRFILEAVQHELARRRREELRRSLRAPHPESAALAAQGLAEWATGLPEEDPFGIVDMTAGRAVRWTPGRGWTAVDE